MLFTIYMPLARDPRLTMCYLVDCITYKHDTDMLVCVVEQCGGTPQHQQGIQNLYLAFSFICVLIYTILQK